MPKGQVSTKVMQAVNPCYQRRDYDTENHRNLHVLGTFQRFLLAGNAICLIFQLGTFSELSSRQ